MCACAFRKKAKALVAAASSASAARHFRSAVPQWRSKQVLVKARRVGLNRWRRRRLRQVVVSREGAHLGVGSGRAPEQQRGLAQDQIFRCRRKGCGFFIQLKEAHKKAHRMQRTEVQITDGCAQHSSRSPPMISRKRSKAEAWRQAQHRRGRRRQTRRGGAAHAGICRILEEGFNRGNRRRRR